jgi:hypothetical protein
MTRTPILNLLALNGLAAAIAAAGITLLVKPAVARALLRLPDSEPAAYALRIGGAMILASALFLAGFATAYQLATAS